MAKNEKCNTVVLYNFQKMNIEMFTKTRTSGQIFLVFILIFNNYLGKKK
jgi:uncharacterized membrane protein YwzB